MKLLVIIPAYNEAKVIGETLGNLPKSIESYQKVDYLVVDDGSQDETAEIAKSKGFLVVRHIINLGLGGAIGTGLLYAKENNYDCMVTFDSDGQHAPEDLIKVATELAKNQADVIIGSRLINSQGMPWHRKLGNLFLNFITRLFFGVKTTDSQSGLRGFGKRAIELINIKTTRYEVSSEVFSEITKHRLILKEVPIKAIYTDYSLSKGQKNINALPLITRLFWRKIMR